MSGSSINFLDFYKKTYQRFIISLIREEGKNDISYHLRIRHQLWSIINLKEFEDDEISAMAKFENRLKFHSIFE